MASSYTIVGTQPTVYNDPVQGVVNGALVRFKINDYDEVHEVRIPKLDAKLAKSAIEDYIKQRDAIEALTGNGSK